MQSSDWQGRIVISVLGGFQLSVNGRPVGLALREMRLLALLAVRGPNPREVVSGTLWPETTQERAAASLRVAIHTVRHAVPTLLDVQRGVLGLAGQVRTDLALLRECLTVASSRAWADRSQALQVLSGGELLAGWRDDWVVYERERMRHRRLRALAALGGSCLDAQDPRTALAAARAAESIEPLRQRTHLLAVQAMLMMGRGEEALEHHRRFVARLSRELGISPSEQFIGIVPAG